MRESLPPDETEIFRNEADRQYLALLANILQNGFESTDRTGTGTKKLDGQTLKFDLADGYPLLTTKKVWFHGVKEELLWMVRGETNIRPLVLKRVNTWNDWPLKKYLEARDLAHIHPKRTPELWQAEMEVFTRKIKENETFANVWGDLGPVYGYQWRHWPTFNGEIDQLADAITSLKENPDSRRIVVSAWNPADIDKMALPPCHMIFQFEVTGERLNCIMTQRSADVFLGLPWNIASYALLTEIVAQITDKKPGNLTITIGDAHLYLDHLEQAQTQLTREPRELPKLAFDSPTADIDSLSGEAIRITGYNPHPPLLGDISL